MESLETRLVLSAPPMFVNIPASITVGEFTEAPIGRYFYFQATATDADSAPSQLTYSIDTYPSSKSEAWISPEGGWFHFANYQHATYQENITIRVTDETGLYDTASFVVNVVNVPPRINASPTSVTCLPGQQVLGDSVDVVENTDTLEAWWDYGDGTVTPPQPLTGGMPIPFTKDTLYKASGPHAYTRPGTFTPRLFVRDQHGEVVSAIAASVTVLQFGVDSAGVLRAGGTTGNDNMHVSPAAGGKTNVFIGGAYKGAVTANSVIVYGNEGDDLLDAAPDLAIPVEYHGGPGNDLLRGGAKNDLLFGEAGNDGLDSRGGNDILVGGDGNDIAFAGVGNDLLIGGLGSDSLYGEAGDDVLISGKTNLDESAPALQGALGSWNVQSDYDTRAQAMRLTFLSSIQDNASDVDWLWGGTYGIPDRDYFMSSSLRTLFADRLGNEQIN